LLISGHYSQGPTSNAVNLSAVGNQLPAAGAHNSAYQLDFTTPGNLPWDAKFRKQIRQTPNFLRKARGRPQTGHRL